MLVWCYVLLYLYSYLSTAEDEEESRGTVHGSEASGTETNKEMQVHVCMYMYIGNSSLVLLRIVYKYRYVQHYACVHQSSFYCLQVERGLEDKDQMKENRRRRKLKVSDVLCT